jgi:hypothetical protein
VVKADGVIEEALALPPEERLWLLEQLCLYEVLVWVVDAVKRSD